MRNTYTTSLLIFAAAIFLTSCILGKRDKTKAPLMLSIQMIMMSAPFTMAAYALALLSPNELLAKFMYALYYTVSDWLLVHMLIYALLYTHIYEMKKWQRYAIGTVLAVDGVLMMLNVFFDEIFVFNCGVFKDKDNIEFYVLTERGGLYNFHRFIIYGMVVLIVIPLVTKVIKSPVMYRKKYWITLACLAVIIIANVLYLVLDFQIDFSVLTYGLMAVAIYYFNVVYVPQGLMSGLLSSSIKNMDDGVICFDIEGNCIYANSVAYTMFKCEGTELFSEYCRNWTDGDDIGKIEDTSRRESRGEGDAKKYYNVQFKRMCDDMGNYVGCFFKFHDETEDFKKLKAERFRATHDRLTGIYNREHFYEVVENMVLNAEPDTYCMVCSDIKDFKLVNDIFGINTGDEILLHIANSLKTCATKGSVYARLSGDRFAICMLKSNFYPDIFVEQIAKLREIKGIANSSYHLHVHVGVYDIVDKNVAPSVMCDRAYMAINTIKSSIADTVVHYDEKMRQSTISEKKVTNEFGSALESGQFSFYIQPQVSVTGKVLGGEALVRWIHPERGLIPPGEFIEILERTGLICKLDLNTWELACKKLREWKDRGFGNYHRHISGILFCKAHADS